MEKLSDFRFRDRDQIGFADADRDFEYLKDCFIDTGDLEALTNCRDPRCLILGRTGVGKTALLSQIPNSQERVIALHPEHLAFTYISNSSILNYVANVLNADLDLFFRLLWRHVMALELIQKHFNVHDESSKNFFIATISAIFRTPRHAQAVRYLESYAGKFWEMSDQGVVENTTKLELELTDAVKASFAGLGLDMKDVEKLSTEQKSSITQRAQKIIDSVHIEDLSKVIEMLGDALKRDPQKSYYVVIDKLDERWIEDKTRYKLIRALIETASYLNHKIPQMKVILTLRVDLLERVYELTKDHGFQREKYADLNLELKWTKPRLIELVDARIHHLVRSRYQPTKIVTHANILPKSMGNILTIDYMLERTLDRPRDIIDFFNCCINHANTCPEISKDMITEAEGEYSSSRLDTIYDEWAADYPNLKEFIMGLLKGRTSSFAVKQMTDEQCFEFCYEYTLAHRSGPVDALSEAAAKVGNSELEEHAFRALVLSIFYKVSAVGMKIKGYETIMWSHRGRRSIQPEEISQDSSVSIHPCLYRVLSIHQK